MALSTTLYISYVTQYGTAPATVARTTSPRTYALTIDDLPTLSYPGYVFLGWSIAEGSTDIVAVGDVPWPTESSLTARVTLYAVWEVARTIQSEIDRISGNISSTYTALGELGATMPETQNSDNLEATVRTLTAGGVTMG